MREEGLSSFINLQFIAYMSATLSVDYHFHWDVLFRVWDLIGSLKGIIDVFLHHSFAEIINIVDQNNISARSQFIGDKWGIS